MQTVTLRVSDDFMPKLDTLLDILPKNKVKIQKDTDNKVSKKELQKAKLKKELQEAFEDVKKGRAEDTSTKVVLSI